MRILLAPNVNFVECSSQFQINHETINVLLKNFKQHFCFYKFLNTNWASKNPPIVILQTIIYNKQTLSNTKYFLDSF